VAIPIIPANDIAFLNTAEDVEKVYNTKFVNCLFNTDVIGEVKVNLYVRKRINLKLIELVDASTLFGNKRNVVVGYCKRNSTLLYVILFNIYKTAGTVRDIFFEIFLTVLEDDAEDGNNVYVIRFTKRFVTEDVAVIIGLIERTMKAADRLTAIIIIYFIFSVTMDGCPGVVTSTSWKKVVGIILSLDYYI
jgi:hypothetical protein